MTPQAIELSPCPAGGAATPLRPGRRQPRPEPGGRIGPGATVVGTTALVFSALYFLSDVVEVVHGGFSVGQLWLTLAAEAAIPMFVVGLAILHRRRLGRLGLVSAAAYAYSYVVFTGTVVYALVNHTEDYEALNDHLGTLMTAHGAIMVLAGLGFGFTVLRTRLLPAWTGLSLMVGVVLVATAQGLPDGAQLVAAGVRDLGFAGMGAALLRTRRATATARPDAVAATSTGRAK
ncbi:MAG: hypothetical protein QOD98_3059 [Nocardioidaceae bacterium]|jgi:hypothetical protein|nr:hypothetical protein [Nocardioidaceae bacterium]